MNSIEKLSLFKTKREFFSFLLFCFIIFLFSLSYQFYKYKEFTKFDSQLVDAAVLKQYTKTKLTKHAEKKEYQILKLRTDEGLTFYTTAGKKLPNLKNKKVQIELWAGDISFYKYLQGFFTFSKIRKIYKENSLKQRISALIDSQHAEQKTASLYKALFLAIPLKKSLQTTFSNLGISHLIAISGFHLGVLSAVLFLLLKYPYKFLQNRYFPYRSYKKDTFVIISFILFLYMIFLNSPPSLLRAFGMLLVGFYLYTRGYEIISMQTLLVTALLILSLFPMLIFSVGFWLSIAGVFYIFLFLLHFQQKNKIWQFIVLPFWVYLMMLPYSLVLFGNFGIYHPFSILWTSLFTLFYPLSIAAHLLGHGDIFDGYLMHLMALGKHAEHISLHKGWVIVEIILSLLSLYKQVFLKLLSLYCLFIFIYLIYNVA